MSAQKKIDPPCDETAFEDLMDASGISKSLTGSLKAKFQNAPAYVHSHLETALGEALNPNLTGCARILERHGFDEEETVTVIKVAPSHREADEGEIEKAVCTVFNTENHNTGPKWPGASLDAIAKVRQGSPVKTVEDLQVRFPMEGSGETLDVLKRVFGPDERIAFAKCPGEVTAESALLKNIKTLKGMQMICPNPRSKEFGLTKEGKQSRKCKDNDPGQRRVLVIEFDRVNGEIVPKNTQAALLWHLSGFGPLELVVNSGGKSLQGWFDCHDKTDAELLPFMQYAVSLGADDAMWTISQWSRMPGGVRQNFDKKTGKRLPDTKQEVLVCRPQAARGDDWHLDKLPDTEKSQPFPRVFTGAEIKAEFSEAPVEVIKGIIARGEKLQLSGSSKAGKTWAMLHLAEAVQSGGKFLGLQCVQGNVLFLNFELSPTRLRERIDNFPALGKVDFLNFRGIHCDWPMIKAGLSGLNRDYALIIIDPIYKMLGDADENANGAIAELLHHVEAVANSMNAATGYSHHHSKGNHSGTEQIDRSSGAGTWGRDPDALLSLTPHEDDGCLTFEATLRNYSAMESSVWRFDFPRFIHCPGANPKDLKKRGGSNKKGSYKDAVAEISGGTPLSKAKLAAALAVSKDVSDGTARRWITDAETRGLIEKIDGQFVMPGEEEF
jgi:hypothetical protein